MSSDQQRKACGVKKFDGDGKNTKVIPKHVKLLMLAGIIVAAFFLVIGIGSLLFNSIGDLAVEWITSGNNLLFVIAGIAILVIVLILAFKYGVNPFI